MVVRASVAEWTFPRGTASVQLMVDFAAEHGVPAAELLRGSAISEEAAADPATQIDAHQELAVVRNLVRRFGGEMPELGLRVGCRYQASTFGIFGFAVLSCRTLRDVIAFALRYWELSFAFSIPSVDFDGDEIRIQLHDEAVPQDVRQFAVERDIAAMFTVMNELLAAPIPVHRAEFRFPEPSYVDTYAEVFGIRPAFGARANLAFITSLLLDQPLPRADPETVARCEASCRELVARRRARTGLPQEVRSRLVRLGAVDVGMDAIAAELHLSTRTLRRRLEAAGTSYRELLDEVREALAEEMLATGALSVSDVAIRLGYAEATSFIYAFRRWKGTTPAAYAASRS